MPHITQLIVDYGYLAVFIGCLLEGETLLVMAGFAAQQGHLSLAAIIAIAFAAGALGDQLFYWIGRAWGPLLIARHPRLHKRAGKVAGLLQRHDAKLIVGVRFMYGVRILGPIIIGASRVAPARFIAFNLLGAAIWAPLVAGAGYFFGHALERMLGDLEHFEALAFALIAASFGVYSLIKSRRAHSAKPLREDPPDSRP
ncbi:DedA family protein [Variovorax sp. OV329]|uniref:DedA family protein n=1 Tax=Variovorax sp. OV329 TaxID=1882825 RepID=UPI0008E8645E|nr:DedA family protein [Variovorax sp. OV329]SFL96267.1 membrane protein DedA, SNARE-associated domain [Variovorax sp. OV329]